MLRGNLNLTEVLIIQSSIIKKKMIVVLENVYENQGLFPICMFLFLLEIFRLGGIVDFSRTSFKQNTVAISIILFITFLERVSHHRELAKAYNTKLIDFKKYNN